jgi:signal transduction histidine kinase
MRVNHLEDRSSFDEEQQKLAQKAIELLDEGIETIRNLSSELDPPVGDQSLRDSLEWLALHMEESYYLTVELKARGTAKTADKNLRHLLFRLVRELLFNTVKHAEVDEAFLFLVEGEDRLRIVVEDEGTGFDPEQKLEEKEGLGLVSVRERIQMIGGSFEVDAAPGEGTRIVIEVPWKGFGQVALSAA